MTHFTHSPFSHFCLLAVIILACCGCSDKKRDAIGQTEVVLETSEGDIVLRLYDDTPLHRDNFVRLARAGVYDGIVFHRVVKDMVIQTGDPSLRALKEKSFEEVRNDDWNFDYTVPAEIVYPRHFHKQGALAMAHEPDSINPELASSSTQFYIVTGEKKTSAELAELQNLLYDGKVMARFASLQKEHAEELARLKDTDHAAQQQLLSTLERQAENELAANPPKPFNVVQKQVYASRGGAPHLDGAYTVFGEVVEGMPVALRIGRTPTDASEHPRREVVLKRVIVR